MKKKPPGNIQQFLEEYCALCDKHGVMIFSDGEPLHVTTEPSEDLWGAREMRDGKWEPKGNSKTTIQVKYW